MKNLISVYKNRSDEAFTNQIRPGRLMQVQFIETAFI